MARRHSFITGSTFRWLLLALCLLGVGPAQARSSKAGDTPVVDLSHRPGVNQQLRAVTLPNGMEVLLVSDPGARTSTAALDVAVGSMEDPGYGAGVAHYLEHMLFLGTRKYPDVGEYGEYLSANQGWSNAYTDGSHTNYHFEVIHEAYEGALDRFSQFFIAPVFDPQFMEREKNAVDSEHSKNLQNDYWRRRNVERITHKPGHPRTSFATGSMATLKDVSREQVMDFYQRFYSANVMRLCLLSSSSLDDLEDLARTYFSGVPNTNRGPLEYSQDLYAEGSLPEMLEVEAVSDVRELRLLFSLPPQNDDWAAKNLRMIGSVIGYEGKGSLLSELKRRGLATGLSISNEEETWATYFHVVIDLTEEGRARTDEVLSAFYACRAMLLKEGLPRWYWAEQKAMGELEYVFREHMEGAQLASWYAAAMQESPGTEIERRAWLVSTYDPQGFRELLERMAPANLRVVLLAPELDPGTVLVDPDYDTKYTRRTLDPTLVQSLEKTKARREIHFPAPNPFLPDRLELQAQASDQPGSLIPASEGEFWFECNTRFGLPKANLSLLLLSPEINRTPRSRLLAKLYVRALNESLNEWRYDVREAGLYLTISDEARGIRLGIEGFSQRIPDLLEGLPQRLTTLDLDQARFEVLRTELGRELDNTALDQGYSQCFYELGILLSPGAHHRQSYRALIDGVSLDEVRTFASTLYTRVALEGAATGNLEEASLKEALLALRPGLKAGELPLADRPQDLEVALASDQARSWVFQTRCNNACWVERTQLGARSPELEAVLRVGSTWLESGFYEELRTNQQLGYIVFSGATLQNPLPGVQFVIQSSVQPATELRSRARIWLAEQREPLAALDAGSFAALKAAIVEQLDQPDKDLSERLGKLLDQGVRLDGRFAWKQDVIQALNSLSLEQFQREFARVLDPDGGARLGIYLDAEGTPASEPVEAPVGDPESFRNGLSASGA
ncbi:MAG: insulinase family protein [Calditrichaeota bacterium]|nr:insulinase family protein [Calditrichota bacterium]